ncbi:hypothetical protein KSP40_PGU019895 [Platanthera guangdongensis]|uniref:Uncharacterized protein n=1 Tax=Platanthera guangdongensis TaxID=2320717 RepID=A0ABR2LL83_9ASPA
MEPQIPRRPYPLPSGLSRRLLSHSGEAATLFLTCCRFRPKPSFHPGGDGGRLLFLPLIGAFIISVFSSQSRLPTPLLPSRFRRTHGVFAVSEEETNTILEPIGSGGMRRGILAEELELQMRRSSEHGLASSTFATFEELRHFSPA